MECPWAAPQERCCLPTERAQAIVSTVWARASSTVVTVGSVLAMSFSSDSTAQRRAESLILEAVEAMLGVALHPQRLRLAAGAVVDVDGFTEDESAIVEVFAHQGKLKAGQRHKIATDVLKLITIAHERTPAPTLILAFGDPDIKRLLGDKSWLTAAINAWGIKVVVAPLDASARAEIRLAQARQVMVNPSE